MRGIAETSGAWSDLLAPRCRQRQYWSPSSCIQDKGDYITAAVGTHASHVIITTCVGLRKHRARGRICSHPDATNGSIGRLHLASQDKGDYITAVGGTHASHVISTTCVGLRKRRARARILLASNPAKACSPLSLSPAASRNCGHDRFMGLAILAPHRNIYAFRYERKRTMHSQPPPRSSPKIPASTP